MIIEALEVLWSITPVRRLLGGVLLLGGIVLAIALYGAHRELKGWDAGHKAGADSAWLADKRKEQIVVDSLEHHADSLRLATRDSMSALARDSRRLALPPRLRVDTVAVATAPAVPLVSVFVESDSASYPTHPRLAQLLVWQDSLIHQVAVPLIARQQSVIAQLDTALDAEHNARLGADSLTAAWRLRALSATPKAGMSWQEKVLHAATWIGVTLIVRNQMR